MENSNEQEYALGRILKELRISGGIGLLKRQISETSLFDKQEYSSNTIQPILIGQSMGAENQDDFGGLTLLVMVIQIYSFNLRFV